MGKSFQMGPGIHGPEPGSPMTTQFLKPDKIRKAVCGQNSPRVPEFLNGTIITPKVRSETVVRNLVRYNFNMRVRYEKYLFEYYIVL